MGISAKQTGWGTESNLLWQISKQLELITGQLAQMNNNFTTTTTTTTTP